MTRSRVWLSVAKAVSESSGAGSEDQGAVDAASEDFGWRGSWARYAHLKWMHFQSSDYTVARGLKVEKRHESRTQGLDSLAFLTTLRRWALCKTKLILAGDRSYQTEAVLSSVLHPVEGPCRSTLALA